MPFFQSPNMCVMPDAGTFCIWLEIKMLLDKYFGPICFSISTVFRTSRCVTYNIWTGSFWNLWGFMFILFARFKDFVHNCFSTSWLIFITCNKILQEIQVKIDSDDYENVPSLEIFLSFCWIGLIHWIDFKITYLAFGCFNVDIVTILNQQKIIDSK